LDPDRDGSMRKEDITARLYDLYPTLTEQNGQMNKEEMESMWYLWEKNTHVA